MTKKLLIPIALITIIQSFSSKADVVDDFYLGGFVSYQKVSDLNDEYKTIGGILGYQFNEYFSLEGRLATGISSDASHSQNTPLRFSNQHAYQVQYSSEIALQSSVNLKVSYPITNSLNVYGLVGFTNTKINTESTWQVIDQAGNILASYNGSGNTSPDGANYGLGLDYEISKNYRLFIDYQMLPNFRSNNWHNATLGVKYSF
ncbi:porin family protein [Colwellia sp. D2M02]|uniref:porin family protein n=1 Tax=Colwellia sp. D2M02 TaxID=2841562 RepID=UPI001C09F8F8|nr:porin family protein [Colwellia sp. D2M02]MBU2891866.1 porin family protein [Colwellia sp. D2M02]